MYDVHVIFRDGPGELARFGQLLGRNGVGLEGGGVFGTDAHFLVEDGEKARRVLVEAGFTVQAVRKPVIRKLRQARPGELGEIAAALAALAARGVSVLTQYSDHANHLILLTDDDKLAAEITEPWAAHVKDKLTD
ncbi:amino acid-binding protein [Enterobacter bugandensis]|uniref:amino acid-binding protein n=1 Tax=Enterobacter bugandensis TaxID=881260 RepID=UPI002361F98F|nr:amino acid-binding protein [Enterobacter bugandensis]